ncbi:MAG TPA: serine/threonine-protein kinase [Kofleriaceae bacterium]|nr:serine/threonine-protein kinase [Kofleriaceae bacterium]
MSPAPAPAELPVQLGALVDDKFRVERVLGAGGMGIVVEATHLLLRQRVALKFIRREIARDATNVARFLREARACVQLRSEHIARIMDVGTLPDDTPFIVMEYLEGRTVDEIVKADGRLPAATAVGYVLQACVGMAEAHALGIVHRDLKPHNLFVTTTPAGRALVKILDFGISKAALTGGAGDDHALTDSRTIVGSPAYMAPEQMESSRDVDARADIWSLGAILFALCAGHPPFRGATLLQLCARVETGERETLDAEAFGVPAGVVDAIDACLKRAPAQRPADLGELAQRLAPYTTDGDELAAEVAATLRTTRRAPAGDTPLPGTPPPSTPPPARASTPPARGSSGGLDSTIASSDESLVEATPAPALPSSGRSTRRLAAIAAVVALVVAGGWYVTRDRSKAATGASVPPDATGDTSGGTDASGLAPQADAEPPAPDANDVVDAAVPHRPRPPTPQRSPAVNHGLPPPPPPPPPAIDAGVTDSIRHPRDRRN